MSNNGPNRHESSVPKTEPYRGAYVRHNLKKNEVPTIASSRKLHAVSSNNAGLSGDGQSTTGIARARQGGLMHMEDSAGLADRFNSSMVFADSDDLMGEFSDVTDEEFVSADKADETITQELIGSHRPIDYAVPSAVPSDAVNVAPSVRAIREARIPTSSLDFNLPQGGLGNSSAPCEQGKDFVTAYNHNHLEAGFSAQTTSPAPVDIVSSPDSREQRNKSQVVNNRNHFRTDSIIPTVSQAPVVFTPPCSADQGKIQGINNRSYLKTGADVPMEIMPPRQSAATLNQNFALGAIQNHTISMPLSTTQIIHSAGIQSYLPASNVNDSTGPLRISMPCASPPGIDGQGNEPEAVSKLRLAMAGDEICPKDVASPMEGIDCIHSSVHSVNIANEGTGGVVVDNDGDSTSPNDIHQKPNTLAADQVHKVGTNVTDHQGVALVPVRHITSPDYCCSDCTVGHVKNDKHGRHARLYNIIDEVEEEDSGESDVEQVQDSDGGVDHGRNYWVLQKKPRQSGNYSRGRKRASKQTYTPMPFTDAENDFKASIRLQISEMFGHQKPYPIQTPSREQLEAFKRSQKMADGPNLEMFLLDFEGPTVFTPWNERLALLLANEFLKEPNSFTNDTVQVQRAFMVYFRTLHQNYQEGRVVITEGVTIKKQQVQRRTNQTARQRKLHDRREWAAEYYANEGSQMKVFSKLWKRMPKEVCSDDEEVTYPNGTQFHEILTPAWRNVAVKTWFRTWDHLAISIRYGPDGKPNPGRFPHVRVEAHPVRRDPRAKAPKHLPLNFYDRDWYEALDGIEKQKLGAGPAISLTFPPKIVRTAERYEHVKDRYDKPLDPDDPTLTLI